MNTMYLSRSGLRRFRLTRSQRRRRCAQIAFVTVGSGLNDSVAPACGMDSRPLWGRCSVTYRGVESSVAIRTRTAETVGPDGFTLLEIILALAILAGAMATLGEVMRLADQNATMTEGETQAQILAASLMDEFACGSREIALVGAPSPPTGLTSGRSPTQTERTSLRCGARAR